MEFNGSFFTTRYVSDCIFDFATDWDDSRRKKEKTSVGAKGTVAWRSKGLCMYMVFVLEWSGVNACTVCESMQNHMVLVSI